MHLNKMKMKPIINSQNKDQLIINDQAISYDFYINPDGDIIRRVRESTEEDRLNILTLTEASDYYDPNINEMIIGWRSDDKLMLSNEATDFFEEKRCKIKLLPLDEAITYWNRYEGHAVGLFHLSK